MGRQLATYFILETGITFEEAKKQLLATDLSRDWPIPEETIRKTRVRGHAFLDVKPLDVPQWFTTFRTLTKKQLRLQADRSVASGVFLIECFEKLWLVCFGAGHKYANGLHYERRFGRILLSNAVMEEGAILGFAARTFGRNPRSRQESTAAPGPLERLEFFREANRLTSIKARIKLGNEEFTLVGGDSFRFFQADDLAGFVKVFKQLLKLWDGGRDNNKSIALKDPFMRVTDPALIAELDVDFENALRVAHTSCFSLGALSEEGWNAHTFSLTLGRQKELTAVTGLDVDFVLHAVRQHLDNESDRAKLKLAWTYEDDTKDASPIRGLLSYEQPQKKNAAEIFVRDDSRWWSYKREWVAQVEAQFAEAIKSMEQESDNIGKLLPALVRGDVPRVQGKKQCENHWIEKCADEIDGAIKLHLGLIKPGPSKSGFELADLYLPEARYLHAKIGCTLTQVDAVCNQAEEAALMMSTPDFKQAVVEKLSKLGLRPKFMANSRETVFGIVLIANKQELSSRAKERVVRFFDTIYNRGYTPAVTWVNDRP